MNIKSVVILLVLIVLMMNGCNSSHDLRTGTIELKGMIKIGGLSNTEQHILVKITSIYLEENGYYTEEVINLDSHVVQSAIAKEQIDMYWEYVPSDNSTKDHLSLIVTENIDSNLQVLLNELMNQLTEESINQLVEQVTIENRSIVEVSRMWLEANELINI